MKSNNNSRKTPAKPTAATNENRQDELAKIHIGKQQLGLDDDTYRAMLQQVGGVNSAKDLTGAARIKVLEHLKSAGFKGSKPFKGRPHNADSTAANAARLSKIEALLADAKRPWGYVVSMAKHMYKKDKLEFCSGKELSGIIAALVKDAEKRKEVGHATQ